MNGTVKFYNTSKGFGFITGEDGKDYFFHKTSVKKIVKDGDAVSFDVEQGEKGPKAVNVE
jgi:CspA family cold shock protein